MSTSRFHLFAAVLAGHFAILSQGEVYRATISGDDLWNAYLAAFPAGTDPMFRKRTEHDGSYDRNFIRQLGNLVRINDDGTLTTIWDLGELPHPYGHVASVLSDLVKGQGIHTVFRTKEAKFGYVHTIEKREGQDPIKWHHFHADIPKHLRTKSVGEACGEFDSTCGVIRRGFAEIMPSAVDTVLDLIDQNALYRGAEFRTGVAGFKASQEKFLSIADERQRSIVVARAVGTPGARLRNTAIGTLLQELTEGMELEKAVKRFEKMVAPANYKRPTSLITPKMVEQAVTEIRELGLESALQRRHATLADIRINNVLWADNQAQSHMKDGLTDLLMGAVKKPVPNNDQIMEISIEDFQANVLPGAKGMDVYLENKLRTNLVSLTAPVHADAGQLFKWGNGFAWTYNGNITDSEMRRAVQEKGGRVDGVFRFTHQWNYGKRNASLMDLHVLLPAYPGEPRGHTLATHGVHASRVGWNHRKHAASGGVQDVDYVEAAPVGYVPVENITFPDVNKMPEGVYRCYIHNWSFRSPTEGGFKAEIEFGGQVFEYEYDRPLKQDEWVAVAEVTLRSGQFSIEHKLPHAASSQEIWGLKTQDFIRVETVLNSPNHWDGERTGNKHWFFILEGCKNPDPARGIYNEFLKPELDKHRKVFEVLGSKTKVEPSDQQLSGVGFSSTKRDSVVLRVTGSNSTKLYKVNF